MTHEERCREIRQTLYAAWRFMRGVERRHAPSAEALDRMCRKIPYEGSVLFIPLDEVIGEAKGEENE